MVIIWIHESLWCLLYQTKKWNFLIDTIISAYVLQKYYVKLSTSKHLKWIACKNGYDPNSKYNPSYELIKKCMFDVKSLCGIALETIPP